MLIMWLKYGKIYIENNMKIGQIGSYGFLNNLKITEINDKYVIMTDKFGNNKKVYKELAIKYFKSDKEG